MSLVENNGYGTVRKVCKKGIVLERNRAQLGKALSPRTLNGDAVDQATRLPQYR